MRLNVLKDLSPLRKLSLLSSSKITKKKHQSSYENVILSFIILILQKFSRASSSSPDIC